jgi:hypothetical protein
LLFPVDKTQVASHTIEKLWQQDGLSYHTAIIDASADSIGPYLPACCAFLERCGPAIICCASGQGLSVLVCAAHIATSSRDRGLKFSETPSELLRHVATQRDVFVPFPANERQAFVDFCAARMPAAPGVDTEDTTMDEVAPSTPLSKPASSGGSIYAIDLVKAACSGRKRFRSDGEEDEEETAEEEVEAEVRRCVVTPQAKVARPLVREEEGRKSKEAGLESEGNALTTGEILA